MTHTLLQLALSQLALLPEIQNLVRNNLTLLFVRQARRDVVINVMRRTIFVLQSNFNLKNVTLGDCVRFEWLIHDFADKTVGFNVKDMWLEAISFS